MAASATSCEATAVSWSVADVPRLVLPTAPPGYATTAYRIVTGAPAAVVPPNAPW